MFWRGCFLALALASSTLCAQEAAKKEPAKPSGQGSEAAAGAFDQKLGEWKAVVSELERIRAAWKIAMPDERKKLEQEFNDKLAEGETLLPEMIKAAEQAFAEGGAN